jgi:glycosyltransferase involved in cell wall biosynthesis
LIEASSGGLLVDPDDPAALAVGLQRMLVDHELRDRAGRAGEAAVRERFSAETMAKETIAVLERHVRPTTLPT